MESKIVYFEDIRHDNTESTFKLAKERAEALGLKKLVLASTTGTTAKRAMDFFKGTGIKLIVVPHQFDFHRKENPFPQDLVKTLRDLGHEVHFGTMLFHTDNLYGATSPTVIANILRCFCQGVKVCFEIVLMATDAGLVGMGEKVIVLAGTGRGSDTALVMQASSSQHPWKIKVNEILCKPLNPLNLEEMMEMRERSDQGKAGS